MNESDIVHEFEKLADRLEIALKYNTEGPSGLCTVKGEKTLYIDKSLSREAKIKLFAREFKSLDLEGIFLVPMLRALLDTEESTEDW